MPGEPLNGVQHLELGEGPPVLIPGTRLALSVESIRHRTGAAAGDAFARSMMTAVFTLWDGDRKLAEARGIDGQRLKLGPVEVLFSGQGQSPSAAAVEVTVR